MVKLRSVAAVIRVRSPLGTLDFKTALLSGFLFLEIDSHSRYI